MKKCSYCGIENDDPASHCKECGTELATESPVRVAEQLRQLRGKVAAELSGLRKPRNLIVTIVVAVAGLAAAAVFFDQSRRLADARRELQQTKARLPELKPLQGYWEGSGPQGDKCSITITGDDLHFYGYGSNWYKATFTLPAGTDPRQLRATIKDGSGHIGNVIFAIFKIEDGTLTLAADEGSGEPPKTLSMVSSALFSLKRRIASNPKSTEPKTP